MDGSPPADDVDRTLQTYEEGADAFVEKYRSESIAARFGDPFLGMLPGDRLLDVGCGPGSDADVFAQAGYDVIGLDLTPSFVRAADRHVSDGTFLRGDMRRLPFRDGAFDGVWSCASFLHVPRSDASATLREFRRVLDGGVVFLSVKRPANDVGPDDPRHFEYYEPDEIRSLVSAASFEPRRMTADENWVSIVADR